MKRLPRHFEPYTDAYFLRSLEILQKEKLNPFIRVQFFIRKGPGKVYGLLEAVKILETFGSFKKNRGRVFSLQEGETFHSEETIMLIEGRAQDIIPFETMMLGVISAETTKANDTIRLDFKKITERMRAIMNVVGNRPVMYFGARHWRYDEDEKISKAAFDGGATDASTDIGASVVGKRGVGTIPHSLECIYAWKYGIEHAVVETLKAFDRHIDPKIPRIALIDFRNREIDDSLLCAEALGTRLFGVRIDTSGENVMQGSQKILDHKNDPYWHGKGVSISGVYAVRKALDDVGFKNIKIVLSSGFGNIEKVHTFVNAEKALGVRLFDSLGVGELFPSRSVTMDIVGVGERLGDLKPISKIGRTYKPNSRLKE